MISLGKHSPNSVLINSATSAHQMSDDVQLLPNLGPAAFGVCVRQRSLRAAAIAAAVVNMLASFAFAAACVAGAYAWTHQSEFGTLEDCPRLVTFTITTTVLLAAHLLFGVLSLCCVRNGNMILFNSLCCAVVPYLVMTVYNIYASVWVWSPPGKYFDDQDCSPRLVDGIRIYLFLFWAFILFNAVFIPIVMAERAKYAQPPSAYQARYEPIPV
jgi:hypothetical protein